MVIILLTTVCCLYLFKSVCNRMSIIDKIQQRKKQIVDELDNLTSNLVVVKEVYNERMNICKSCDSYLKLSHQCRECGCIMNMKAKFRTSECPLGKWK